MQNKGKNKKPIEPVRKPIIQGSWHGKDAWKLARGRGFTMLALTFFYLIAGILLTMESLWARVLACVAVVGAAFYYLYISGLAQGQTDAAFGEILHDRRASGHDIPKDECERSFHPFKGWFAVAIGAIPFVLFALVFALMTRPVTYRLGALPAWTEGLMHQTEFGTGLGYYLNQPGMSALDVMRIIVRAMIMPFVNVAVALGTDAGLWAERLSPLLLLIAPMGYGFGYGQGLNYRVKVNTGIKLGDDKKKRKERKARKQRQRSAKGPEQLI